MKYGSIVRELALSGANWRFYDENFRMLRQSQGTPWDKIHSELWLRSQSFRAKQPIPPREPNRKAPTSPRVIVGNSTGESFAGDAPLSTSVSNAGNLILPQSVKNNNQQQVMIKNLMPTPTEALPTPVRVKRLATYLIGYDAQRHRELLCGFDQGFVCIFKDLRLLSFQRTYSQHFNTQTLLIRN